MPKCNIYVSPSAQTVGSHKPQTVFYLSLEPKKRQIPLMPHSNHPEPLHYSATADKDSGLYKVQTHNATGEPMIVGNILVAEKVKTTPEQVLAILKGKLSTAPSSLPSEQASPENPDAWVRKALHRLQEAKVLAAFDVGEFMTFAHAYAAQRADGDGAAMVAYPRLNKDYEKKAKSGSFWVDYPMASKPRPRNRIEGNQGKYGTLM